MTDPNNPFGINQNAAPSAVVQQEMTNILGQVESGPSKAGLRAVISGLEKVGKTTLACDAPRAMLVQLEIGGAVAKVPKTPLLSSWPQVKGLMAEIKAACMAGRFEPKTLVFDTATALERLIHLEVLRRDPKFNVGNQNALTMEAALGGYGKAYSFANELFNEFLGWCDELAQFGGLNIILTCHVFASKVMDPTAGEFHSWDLLLHSPKDQKNYGKREILSQWADLIGFLHEPVFVTKNDGETMAKGQSKNIGKVLAVSRNPGYVAGNRYGITGEISIPDPANVKYGEAWNQLAYAIGRASGIDYRNLD